MDHTQLRIVAKQIKQRVNLIEAASWFGYEYDTARRNPCPVCDHESKSKNTLAIYEDGARWHCFHCSDGGDVIDWLAACHDCSKGQAIASLATRMGISGNVSDFVFYMRRELTKKKSELTAHHQGIRSQRAIRQLFWEYHGKSTLISDDEYIRDVHDFLRLEHYAYRYPDLLDSFLMPTKAFINGERKKFEFTGITHYINQTDFMNKIAGVMSNHTPQEAITRFGKKACDAYLIGLAPNRVHKSLTGANAITCGLLGKQKYFLLQGRMIFPIRDLRGNVIALAGRRMNENDGPKYINTKDSTLFRKSYTLYGMFEAAPYILKRGYAVVVEGYPDVIALAKHGIRNAVAPMGTSLTENHCDLLSRFTREVVTMFDGDEAGLKAQRRADLNLKLARVRAGHLTIPDGEDPETLIERSGAKKMLRKIKDARPGPVDHNAQYAMQYGYFRRKVRNLAQ